MNKFFKYSFLLIGLSLSLQACVFVIGAAAGAAAIAVVYDHRSIQLTLDDTRLADKISKQIKREPALKEDSHINVTVFNKIILLTGETPNTRLRQQAEDIAKEASNGLPIYNQLTIEGPSSSLTRTSDTWITTKIRGNLLAETNLKSSNIKIVTENGIVYLMGQVTQKQADQATHIARRISGVQKVIKVFQYRN